MQTIAGRLVLSPSDLNDYVECEQMRLINALCRFVEMVAPR